MSGIEARFRIERSDFTLDVATQLPGGGVTILFGHSGCGKTTLLRCVAGLEHAVSGYLSVNGEIWQSQETFVPPHRRPVGYVFQEANLFPHLSVRANVDFGRRRAAGGLDDENLAAILDLLGIAHLLARRPDELSGGERQRVAIARALAVKPRLLLMDEPLSALDARRKDEVMAYLERLRATLRIPILYVTHAIDEAERLGDWALVLHGGRIVAQTQVAALRGVVRAMENDVAEAASRRLDSAEFCGSCIAATS
ncbi:MAG: molybdenum ABC transporter ATP-binding protein [Tepidimonas sp.]|uniref:molybdenum ABC transporter ATP-binding protein n=1 Tax=Tepidimonas sp. TaxID=2002775 RepID=UPI00259E1141|nr:molybdenum ABC transporter ATP-binding protein [Tepidimonas sp.]MDM7457095.1 molybdenum ABC transporter ATP-binding protein [Tepidimonas sp.]